MKISTSKKKEIILSRSIDHNLKDSWIPSTKAEESERRYRLLSDNISDSVWVLDMNLNIKYLSPSAERRRGYTTEEIMNMPMEQQFTPQSYVVAIDFFTRVMKQLEEGQTGLAKEQYLELEFTRKEGSTNWLECRFSLIRDENGRPESILAVGRDIHERKMAQKALRQSEERYRLIAENSTDFIWVMDLNLQMQYISPSVEKVRGYSLEELQSMTVKQQMTEASYARASEVIAQVMVPEKLNDPNFNYNDRIVIEYLRKNGSTFFSEVAVSILRDGNGKAIGILGTGRDISERKKMENAQKEVEEKLMQSNAALKKALSDAINTLVKVVEIRDPYTAGHQERVGTLAIAIAREMQLDEDFKGQLRMAASIHDIGKINISAEILSKPGKLTAPEFQIIKTHPCMGFDVISEMDFPCMVAKAVLQHHERLDGSGYPYGLKAEEITLEAKILAVADVVEAMSSHRPYRPALGINKALEEISKNKGKLYDPIVVDTCLRLFKERGFQLKTH